MSAPRHAWDFEYAPVPGAAGDDDGEAYDVVVATNTAIAPDVIARALTSAEARVSALTLFDHAPLHWTRVFADSPARRSDIWARLEAAKVPVRYVASARRGSAKLAPAWGESKTRLRAEAWETLKDTPHRESTADGFWFLREGDGGVGIDRTHCGYGAGTRLAVIDDDAAEKEQLALDACILVGLDEPVRGHAHGALMVGWAVGVAQTGFRGVAPHASPRLYLIPKPGREVMCLPLAIATAARDGADVIVCATYVEGTSSPMLDDAIEFATRLGRDGRGTPVVLPTGRETSSPRDSIHASLSLALVDPASDPRVFCIAPGARGDGWFLWRDKKGKLRPFGNRGPAVRWLSPGDDVADPLGDESRFSHAESSGASAIAAGVMALVLANNPRLTLRELAEVVTRTLEFVPPAHNPERKPLRDPFDVKPHGCDPDGHNAKHGYGRLHATRACLAARDPICAALVAIGETSAAKAWARLRADENDVREAYSERVARWAARAMTRDPIFDHAVRALARHARLIAGKDRRHAAQIPTSFARSVALALRTAMSLRAPPRVRLELETAEAYAASSSLEFDERLASLANAILGDPSASSRDAPAKSTARVEARGAE